MLNFFQMCDLLNKNKSHLTEAESSDDILAKLLAKYGVKSEPSKPSDTAPQKTVNAVTPISVTPETPKITTPPTDPKVAPVNVAAQKTSGNERSLEDLFPDPRMRDKFLRAKSDELHGVATGKIGQKAMTFSFNKSLFDPVRRFFAKIGLQKLQLPFELIDYSENFRNPKNRGRKYPPAGQPFRILFNPMDHGPDDPDFEVMMKPLDFHHLSKFVQEKMGGRERGTLDKDGKSLVYHLVAPALKNPTLEEIAFRAATFENYIFELAGLTTTLTGLAEKLAQLASKETGGLQSGSDDLEALKYLIRTANTNGFRFFQTEGDLDNPASMVKVRSKKDLGMKAQEEDRAGSNEFRRGKGQQNDLLRKLRQGLNLIPDTEEKKEATEWNDLINLMEYWEF